MLLLSKHTLLKFHHAFLDCGCVLNLQLVPLPTTRLRVNHVGLRSLNKLAAGLLLVSLLGIAADGPLFKYEDLRLLVHDSIVKSVAAGVRTSLLRLLLLIQNSV